MAEPTDDRIDTSSGDSVTVRIAAPPERIYAIVTDIENMGRLSPECTGGRWLAGATGPRVGARLDRKSVVEGKGVSVRVGFGGRGILKKKKPQQGTIEI